MTIYFLLGFSIRIFKGIDHTHNDVVVLVVKRVKLFEYCNIIEWFKSQKDYL